jgi:hypothetical protein
MEKISLEEAQVAHRKRKNIISVYKKNSEVTDKPELVAFYGAGIVQGEKRIEQLEKLYPELKIPEEVKVEGV